MDAPSAETIAKAIATFYANPKADRETILQALENAGISPREAWELHQFLPIAFVHVAFRDLGVIFTPDYELEAAGSSARTRHKFADEPIYVAGVAAAEGALADGHTALELRPVFRHSAEYPVILQLVRPDGSMDGIGLTEPILFEYEE
jgi:hypothetical protein